MKGQTLSKMFSRRSFLRVSGVMPLAVAMSSRAESFVPRAESPARSLADLHLADFAALVGQTFRVDAGGVQPFAVQLNLVKDVTRQPDAARTPSFAGQESFSLAFSGPKGQAFPQGLYRFLHPALGSFDLFVVPAMAVEHEERHIAIINRI